MGECVFCKIVKGEISSYKVYEDDSTCVFMDCSEDVDGHMLAVPKKHVKNILDCDEEVLYSLMKTVKKVSVHCVEDCGYDGVNLLNASDESAGQSVPHFHIHIIPRRKADKIDAWPVLPGAGQKIEQMCKKFRF